MRSKSMEYNCELMLCRILQIVANQRDMSRWLREEQEHGDTEER